jgi:hypothetical protein
MSHILLNMHMHIFVLHTHYTIRTGEVHCEEPHFFACIMVQGIWDHPAARSATAVKLDDNFDTSAVAVSQLFGRYHD